MGETAAAASGWSRERVEQLLQAERWGVQRIELPYGLTTPGRDRSATARLIFPPRLDGKTVIDIGCNHGVICFEAARRGARRVLGVDADPEFIRVARLLADCLGLDVQFAVRDIERQPLDESFDYTLSLNLLHHLRNPLSALDNLVARTNERLVLELATVGSHDRAKLGLSWVGARKLAQLPVIFVGKDDRRAKRQVQKFFFTPSAIDNLLMHQRAVFARAAITPSEHKGRFVYLADKRRIEHLLFVCGPTAAGQRTFVQNLRAGTLPEVAARIGIDPTDGWDAVLPAERLCEPSEPEQRRLILVMDFLRPDLHRPKVNPRDVVFDILKAAAKTTFVTLWTPPERLRAQLATASDIPIHSKRLRKRHELLRQDYADPARVRAHYRDWNALVRAHPADHLIVCTDATGTRVMSPGDWERALSGS